MPEITLTGCTPEPLMNYLKALGVFRLVAEQTDGDARLSWAGGVANLHSKCDRENLAEFFLERYEPTPILAPWNGGSGFYGGGSEPVEAIATSDTARLRLYRETISCVRSFIPTSKPKDDDKEALLIRCRSELADEIIPWLDVCFALSEKENSLGELKVAFFPLLGTGGNDGRLEFTNNFMQRLAEVMPFGANAEPKDDAKCQLAAALFNDTLVSLGKSAIGQFNPGGIGGPNGTQGSFEANSRVNPWDFVLMIEGALLFAGSVARRMGSNTSSRAVFPFSVDSVAVGYGSASVSEETTDGSRSELWLPLWDASCTLAEIKQLFGEGRAQLGRRQAKNAVEFALAVNLLGVSRGVSSFARYGFLKRNGLAFLAAPLGRIKVTLRPQARLLDELPLGQWVDRFRRACSDKDKTPGRYQDALRQIDRAMFAFANRSQRDHGSDAGYLAQVLIAIGQAERSLATGLRFAQESYIRPIQGLSAQWLQQADDGGAEFRLAAAIAGVQADGDDLGSIRVFLEAVQENKFVTWSPSSTSVVWSRRSLASNLAGVFRRRQMEAYRAGINCVPLVSRRVVSPGDVLAFLNGETDDERLSDLLWGLLAVDWAKVQQVSAPSTPGQELDLPFEFGVLRLLVEPLSLKDPEGETTNCTTSDPDVFDLLSCGQSNAVELAVDRAARRLKSGGLLVNGYRNRRQAGKTLALVSQIAPDRLLAAMLFPMTPHDLGRIANAVLYPSERKE